MLAYFCDITQDRKTLLELGSSDASQFTPAGAKALAPATVLSPVQRA